MLNMLQLESFKENGYLVVENVIDQTMLNDIITEYDRAMDGLYQSWCNDRNIDNAKHKLDFWSKLEYARNEGLEWFQPLDISLPHDNITEDTPFHFGPAVFKLLTYPKILDIVENLLGSEITSNPIQHVRIKPPERQVDGDEIRAHIVSTDWHQDRGVTLHEADETDMVTVWIAITDATAENGCLQAIPNNKGKSQELLPHCTRKQTAIADGFITKDHAVPLEVKAGGIVLFHPLTPHSSLPNISDGYRWSFDIRYNVTGHPTGRSQFPEFVARSRAQPESELTDWREWKKSWEDTRYKLAHSTHIEQHRWGNSSVYCA